MGTKAALGGSGWAFGKRCALRVWRSTRTGRQRGREISILGVLQDSATLSHGWSNVADSLGDNSEGSSLLHPKDRGLSPALLNDMPGRDLPPQTVVYLCVERRTRLEMSPHYS